MCSWFTCIYYVYIHRASVQHDVLAYYSQILIIGHLDYATQFPSTKLSSVNLPQYTATMLMI